MIDMHAHFLFNVDDGSKTIEETMRIVEKVVKEGITDIIATQHAFNPKFNVSKEEINRQVRLFSTVMQAAGYPMTLHTGQEVRLHEHLNERLIAGEILTLAESRYLLLELPSHSVPAYTVKVIQSVLEGGKIPIIAHPERNRAIAKKPELLEKLIRYGAFAQVTASSVAGHFGKNVQKIALQLIESNLIHTYGSDVHNLDTRPFLYNEGLDVLEKKSFFDIINLLLTNNECILKDEPFIIIEPESPVLKKWWQLIG